MKIRSFLCMLLVGCCLLSALTACREEPLPPKDSTDNQCEDGVCEVPSFDEVGNQVYAMVSPVGYHDVEMIKQAPRLDTLEGKKIALVGGSFMASTTHMELKKCILEQYPTATVYMFDEVGSGGPFSVFGQSRQTLTFQQKLKDLGIDAVISGNCGCGLCTTKECGSSIAAEYIGIPTVTVGAPTFVAQIHSTGVNRGVPVLRCATYPGAFASHSTEELVQNARQTVFPAVVEALTTEITQAEIDLYANEGKRPYDEIVYYGNYEEIQEFCDVNGWTDGLPIVPPTDEKIREYLKFTAYEAEEILGTYALAYRECSVYTVAANAVMAGVPREFMPFCIAFVECMADGEWRRPLASTHGWSPYAWINGPVARQLGIDHGQGMISEETNRALGRFIDLAMLNVGGYYVKENRMGTFGYLSAWTFSEDEETCLEIGWDPYHVTQGYDLNTNTLTAASALQWGNNVTPATDDAEQIMTLMAWDITEKQQNGLGNTNPQVYRTVFITREVARALAAGYSTKELLEEALIETARRPLWMRTYAHYWANTGSQQFDKRTIEEHYQMLMRDQAEQAKMTDTPEWLKGIVEAEKIMTIATMNQGQTPLLVTGDSDRNKFQVMPGGGYVTREIRLPENWDELVAPLGYEPLSSFYLQASDKQENVPESHKEVLPNGTYRLVNSLERVTAEGVILLEENTLYYRSAEGEMREYSILLAEKGSALPAILRALETNCSFTVRDGKVTAVILRPSTSSRQASVDLTSLSADLLDGVAVTVGVSIKQSQESGSVTPSDHSLILPMTLLTFSIDLGGVPTVQQNDAGLLSLNGSEVTLSAAAETGSSAKLILRLAGGKHRTLTLVRQENGLVVTYTVS